MPPLKGFKHPFAAPLLIAVASLYLGATFLGATGSKISRALPGTLQYFTQTACLFPNASRAIIDYRAEGYTCEGGWQELDTRRDFFMHPEDKENRFYRALFFFRRNKPALQSLEAYLITRHNARAAALTEAPIVGVRFLSLRDPLPEPGEHKSWEPRPIADHPPAQRKTWYTTPRADLLKACEAAQ